MISVREFTNCEEPKSDRLHRQLVPQAEVPLGHGRLRRQRGFHVKQSKK